jgi:beta-N-acetylhexosaminidase
MPRAQRSPSRCSLSAWPAAGRDERARDPERATGDVAPRRRQVSEAERNAQRDLEGAEGNAAAARARPSTPATTTAPTAARPPIVQRPIPFGAKRRDEMRAYARRHYRLDSFRLQGPKVIVEHYTGRRLVPSAYDTFARDVPDVELHELPAVCAHFVVDKDATIYQLVRLNNMCRHTVGLNDTAIGIEQVGRSAREILDRPAQIGAVVRLTAWLRCRYAIALRDVIGHNESLSSRYHHEGRRSPAPPDPWRLDPRGDGAGARPDGRYRCPA